MREITGWNGNTMLVPHALWAAFLNKVRSDYTGRVNLLYRHERWEMYYDPSVGATLKGPTGVLFWPNLKAMRGLV